MNQTKLVLMIALGGALGAVSRYWISSASARLFGNHFPWGTLTVNLLGSLLLGYLLYNPKGSPPNITTLWIPIGFLGALTTFSTFSYESYSLLFVQQAYSKAALNILGNVSLCIAFIAIGTWLSKLTTPH